MRPRRRPNSRRVSRTSQSLPRLRTPFFLISSPKNVVEQLSNRIRKLKIREGSRDPKKWREDAQNLTLLMDYLRLLQPPGALLKTLRGKEQLATYRLFANALHFVLSGLTRARAKEMSAKILQENGVEVAVKELGKFMDTYVKTGDCFKVWDMVEQQPVPS